VIESIDISRVFIGDGFLCIFGVVAVGVLEAAIVRFDV
jgi:hypothetical protein